MCTASGWQVGHGCSRASSLFADEDSEGVTTQLVLPAPRRREGRAAACGARRPTAEPASEGEARAPKHGRVAMPPKLFLHVTQLPSYLQRRIV